VWLLLPAICAAPGLAQSAQGAYGSSPMAAHGCPWLTEGTAAHALGGEISVTVSVTNATEGTCRFTRRDETAVFLAIHVSAAALAGCPAGSPPLHGIGNEAARCRVSTSHGVSEEMASGRVRDVHFTVVMVGRSGRRDARSTEPDELARIADEVTGNLF